MTKTCRNSPQTALADSWRLLPSTDNRQPLHVTCTGKKENFLNCTGIKMRNASLTVNWKMKHANRIVITQMPHCKVLEGTCWISLDPKSAKPLDLTYILRDAAVLKNHKNPRWSKEISARWACRDPGRDLEILVYLATVCRSCVSAKQKIWACPEDKTISRLR